VAILKFYMYDIILLKHVIFIFDVKHITFNAYLIVF